MKTCNKPCCVLLIQKHTAPDRKNGLRPPAFRTAGKQTPHAREYLPPEKTLGHGGTVCAQHNRKGANT